MGQMVMESEKFTIIKQFSPTGKGSRRGGGRGEGERNKYGAYMSINETHKHRAK